MFRRSSAPRLLSLLVLLICSATSLSAQTLTPRLTRALGTPEFPWLAADGSYTVWVFFRDKGLAGAELDRALDRAEDALGDKAAWRRAKVQARGARLVDEGDLDLDAGYLGQAAATGAVPRRVSRWLNAGSYQATAAQVRRLAALPCVARVDLVAKFQRPALPAEPLARPDESAGKAAADWSVDYGANLAAMEMFNVPQVHEMGITGQGVVIGMLDGGFHPTHEALIGIPLLAQYDFVNDDGNVDNESGDPVNSRDHGTMTMSTAMGNMPGALVAPAFGASAILAKTEDVSQEIPIEEDNWVAGLEWVEAQGADIVSSSLGYYDWYVWADLDGATAVTTLAGDLGVQRGLVVVNSAGNERGTAWNHIIAPADGNDIIAVGAVDYDGDYSYFSSPGPSYDGRIKPDVAALGSGNVVASPYDDHGYSTASGTSFSCPLTSGVAALVLSRAPGLTPQQVREALRETASMAQSPNNDYGWGLIDAYGAVTYFGPVFTHVPLTDTEDTAGPYSPGMVITARTGLDEASAVVRYRADGGPWQQAAALATGGVPDTFFAEIPGQPDGTVLDYYLEAAGLDGIVATLPGRAPENFFSFRIGADLTPPDLTHTALRDQTLILWPPQLVCRAADNLGVDRVELRFQLNGGSEQGPFDLTADGTGGFALDLPLAAGGLAVGDIVSYTLTAWDTAAAPNATVFGPATFTIIDALGVVLVLDDGPVAGVLDEKIDASRKDRPKLAPEVGKGSAATLAAWLVDAGYVAEVLPAAGAAVEDFAAFQAVVLAAGSNTAPVADALLRTALQQWVAQGGKLLVEGGEIGYDALSSPGYPDFAAQVLHGAGWDADNAGDLAVAGGMGAHPLLNLPNVLPNQITVNYAAYGDEDAVEPTADAYLVMVPLNHQADGGIIVHDDNPAPQSAQIIYLAFNLEALDPAAGRQLAENALAFLLAEETPPSASLAGRVTLAGQADHGGVLIDAGQGRTTLSAADGTWTLPDLYAGSYAVLASKAGWSVDRRDLVLEEGQHLTGVDFTLSPVQERTYVAYPGVAIPDNNATGVTDVITVPVGEGGPLSSVTVDVYIQHTWIGDLTVVLTSPRGTSVVLHNRTGAQDDNILGNWPETRLVDGPGSLDDFIGEDTTGDWTIWASDAVSNDVGQLSMWGLNFRIPAPVSAAGDDGLPRATRLLGNVPNPFNPLTEISFDLARAGRAQLDIFDLRGRLVTRLVDEVLPVGTHTCRWDGRDAQGHGVASGAYLVRLRQGGVVQERKMLLVR